jgi:hypothetical protein
MKDDDLGMDEGVMIWEWLWTYSVPSAYVQPELWLQMTQTRQTARLGFSGSSFLNEQTCSEATNMSPSS